MNNHQSVKTLILKFIPDCAILAEQRVANLLRTSVNCIDNHMRCKYRYKSSVNLEEYIHNINTAHPCARNTHM